MLIRQGVADPDMDGGEMSASPGRILAHALGAERDTCAATHGCQAALKVPLDGVWSWFQHVCGRIK